MKTVRYLKCWPEPFQAVVDGTKRAEWRKEDGRPFEVGDVLTLSEWDPEKEAYTGRFQHVIVSHLVRGPEFGIPEGYVMMSIMPASVGGGVSDDRPTAL